MNGRNKASLSATVCRWLARIIGTVLAASVVFIGIGEGMPNPMTQTAIVQLGFVALALILVGILIGWRWELTGGSLSLVGLCLLCVPVINSPRGLHWDLSVLAIPGILYITSYFLARFATRRSKA